MDWTPIIVAIVAGTPGFLGSLYLLWKIAIYHKTVNSKMDVLLALTRTSAHAEGKLEGIAEAKAEAESSELCKIPVGHK